MNAMTWGLFQIWGSVPAKKEPLISSRGKFLQLCRPEKSALRRLGVWPCSTWPWGALPVRALLAHTVTAYCFLIPFWTTWAGCPHSSNIFDIKKRKTSLTYVFLQNLEMSSNYFFVFIWETFQPEATTEQGAAVLKGQREEREPGKRVPW